jgi:predicted Fe-S protein YdhL (DUF1289 family)
MAGPSPAAAVPSPCVSVCRMSARTGWCEGCLRTLDEIAAWSKMDDDAKRAVWRELPGRRARLAPPPAAVAAAPGAAPGPASGEGAR